MKWTQTPVSSCLQQGCVSPSLQRLWLARCQLLRGSRVACACLLPKVTMQRRFTCSWLCRSVTCIYSAGQGGHKKLPCDGSSLYIVKDLQALFFTGIKTSTQQEKDFSKASMLHLLVRFRSLQGRLSLCRLLRGLVMTRS